MALPVASPRIVPTLGTGHFPGVRGMFRGCYEVGTRRMRADLVLLCVRRGPSRLTNAREGLREGEVNDPSSADPGAGDHDAGVVIHNGADTHGTTAVLMRP